MSEQRRQGFIRISFTAASALFMGLLWLVGCGFRLWRGTAGEGDRAVLVNGGAVVLAILIHEGGHLLTAWAFTVRVQELRVDLFGGRLRLAGLLSYGQEFFIAAAGPFANALTAAFLWPLWIGSGCAGEGFLFMLLVASVGLGGLNLLPVGSMDGGRMLFCGTALLCGERAARGLVGVTTVLCLGALWLFSVYALLRAEQMLSLFVFSLCLLIRMGGRTENGS